MTTRTTARLDRRRFLAGLGLTALTVSPVCRLRAAESADAIVLGAGLAGLYAALLLEEQGLRVTVLEASDRVGGRVQTRTINGQLHELGVLNLISPSCLRFRARCQGRVFARRTMAKSNGRRRAGVGATRLKGLIGVATFATTVAKA